MDDLDNELRLLPDLGAPFWISSVATAVDDVYDQLAKYQHVDFPYYANGYFWQYEQCFLIIQELAQHIEQNGLVLGRYTVDLRTQVNNVHALLLVQDPPQELLEMARGTIRSLRAIRS